VLTGFAATSHCAPSTGSVVPSRDPPSGCGGVAGSLVSCVGSRDAETTLPSSFEQRTSVERSGERKKLPRAFSSMPPTAALTYCGTFGTASIVALLSSSR
jgi:hypothetical protein